MSDLDNTVLAAFQASIETKQESASLLNESIELASTMLNQSLLEGHKILVCGNGGSASNAQHFSAGLLNRYQRDRPGLPAITLTTDSATLTSIANDYEFLQIFSKQVAALGQPGDILLAICNSGQSPNIADAIQAAYENEMLVIALTGKDGGIISQLLDENSVEIRVPSNVTARIEEVHILVIHILCELLDLQLLGPAE